MWMSAFYQTHAVQILCVKIPMDHTGVIVLRDFLRTPVLRMIWIQCVTVRNSKSLGWCCVRECKPFLGGGGVGDRKYWLSEEMTSSWIEVETIEREMNLINIISWGHESELSNLQGHSIRYLGPRLWTKLPKSIRDVTTLVSFKGKIRQLNVSELLDDGCAGCSLCTSWLLYIFTRNPVIR